MFGYDDASSQALCLSEIKCKVVCEAIEDCYGIDMANDGTPRCFLNYEGTCKEYTNSDPIQLNAHSGYDFLYLRSATEAEIAAGTRKLLAEEDRGTSWAQILRYKGELAYFSTGAQYKVCFCDRDVLGG